MSTPGFKLATSRSVGKRSPHCATYALEFPGAKFSYIIRYSRLKCPTTPFFQVQWLTATLNYHYDTINKLLGVGAANQSVNEFVFILARYSYLKLFKFTKIQNANAL